MPYNLDMVYGEAPELKDYVAKFDKPIQSIALTQLVGAEVPGVPPPVTPMYALGILHWVDVVPEEKATEEDKTKEGL